LQGTFVLSINDHPLARELYADCRSKEVSTKYATTARGGRQKTVGELIILGPPGREWPRKGRSKRRRRKR
ncbi:MAG: DNA adenine methylase, partial [Planctomycetota bacterium]